MRVLVTAGSTWAKVDSVRVLTNRFTGKTGLYLAKNLANQGHKVTLLINPHLAGKIAGLRVFSFNYFSQFKEIIEELLRKNTFDLIIHSAAVSDYLPKKEAPFKIASGRKSLNIPLKPAPKIIKIIRRLAKEALLIQFKLEVEEEGIIDKSYKSLIANSSDYVVANALVGLKDGYRAYLIDSHKNIVKISSKARLALAISRVIKEMPLTQGQRQSLSLQANKTRYNKKI